MRSLSLLQGIFPIQGLNPGLPHCRQILYQLSHKGSPRILDWVAYPFSSRSVEIFLTQKLNWGLLHCRIILYQVSYQGSPSTNKITPYSANSFRTRVGKTLAHRPNLFYRLFMWIKFYWKLRELRPNSLSYMLSMAAFMLQWQSWISVTKTGWPAKPKIFAIWPLLWFADPWLRIWTLMPFSTHLYARRVHRFYWILHITEIVPYALFWGLTFFFSWLYVLGIIPWQNIILLIYILWLHSNL